MRFKLRLELPQSISKLCKVNLNDTNTARHTHDTVCLHQARRCGHTIHCDIVGFHKWFCWKGIFSTKHSSCGTREYPFLSVQITYAGVQYRLHATKSRSEENMVDNNRQQTTCRVASLSTTCRNLITDRLFEAYAGLSSFPPRRAKHATTCQSDGDFWKPCQSDGDYLDL